MIIQTVSIKGVFGRWWGYHFFQKMTDNNGNVIEFSFDGKETTEEKANAAYKNYLKIGKGMERKIESKSITIDEYIANLEKSIDPYVEYIDDGRQYREACENNRKIRARIEQFKALKEKGVE